MNGMSTYSTCNNINMDIKCRINNLSADSSENRTTYSVCSPKYKYIRNKDIAWHVWI